MLNKKRIRDIYNERRVETCDGQEPDPEFSTRDLVGLCIIGARIVDTEMGNPRYLSVLDFTDGSSLVFGVEEDDLYTNKHCFWIDSNGGDKYAKGRYLFDGDVIVQEVKRKFEG